MEETTANDFKPGIIPYLTLYEIGKEEFVCGDKPMPFFYTNDLLRKALPTFAKGITLYGEVIKSGKYKTVHFKTVYFKTTLELIRSDLDVKIDLDYTGEHLDETVTLTILKYIG